MVRALRTLFALILCLSLCCGCGAGETADPSAFVPTSVGEESPDVIGDRVVRVENLAGTALSGVFVSVYSDASMTDQIYGGLTDGEGTFSFSGQIPENAVVKLSKLPVGYGAEGSYPLMGEETTISLGIGTMTEADIGNVRYVLGDAVLDFSVTMSDGESYTLSGLLEQHKAVVLNFWFMGCAPCRSEFPHLQEAYEAYSEDVAVLALNPVDSNDAEIQAFRQENGYTFPMGKCDSRWTEMMQTSAFPLTVVIDRYGNISLMHLGAVPDAQVFKDLFAFYCAEDYQQGFYSGIDQVPGIA